MSERQDEADVRALAQERILDALLRALALTEPHLLATIRDILLDTELSHAGKPDGAHDLNQQIRERLDAASGFATQHGAAQTN